jgi:ketosteroid isomerase-like protein
MRTEPKGKTNMLAEDKVTQISHDIRDLINRINGTWLEGDSNDLKAFFHPDIVVQPPGASPRVHGRDACIASYKAFTDQAHVRSFEPRDAEIDVFGETIIASYRYKILYEMDGETFNEDAGDLLVFIKENDSWLVVWRTMIP